MDALTDHPKKPCSSCRELLPVTPDYFHRQNHRPGGLASKCKRCKSSYVRDRRVKNIDASLAREKEVRVRHREKKASRDRVRRANDGEWRRKDLLAKKKWREGNATVAVKLTADWRKKNPDRARELAKTGYSKNREKLLGRRQKLRSEESDWVVRERSTQKAWRAANPVKARAGYRRANAVGKLRNPLRYSVSKAVRNSLKRIGSSKSGAGIEQILGYSIKVLRIHIERQFSEGMTWKNHGSFWELDHIVPLASFKFSSPNNPEFKAAWAITNLRPLSKPKNRSKGGRREHLL